MTRYTEKYFDSEEFGAKRTEAGDRMYEYRREPEVDADRCVAYSMLRGDLYVADVSGRVQLGLEYYAGSPMGTAAKRMAKRDIWALPADTLHKEGVGRLNTLKEMVFNYQGECQKDKNPTAEEAAEFIQEKLEEWQGVRQLLLENAKRQPKNEVLRQIPLFE